MIVRAGVCGRNLYINIYKVVGFFGLGSTTYSIKINRKQGKESTHTAHRARVYI